VLIAVLLAVVALPVAAAQDDHPGRGHALGHAKDSVIVRFAADASVITRGKAAKSVNARSARKVSPLAQDTVVMKLPPGQSAKGAIDELRTQDGVEYVQPDYIVQAAATPNDPRYGDLWGMHGDVGAPSNTFGSGANEAWVVGETGSPAVYVAVLDEGVDTGHADLTANLDVANSYDELNDDPNVFDSSADWHGTHVAGTIGATGGNGLGVVGVNWQVNMISIKMLGSESNSGLVSEIIAAVDRVTMLKNAGLNIVAINASWGAQGYLGDELLRAIREAGDAGLLFVAAAGNEGKDSDKTNFLYYPAAYDCTLTETGDPRGWDCIVSVANMTSSGGLAPTSNYGSATST
jgi:hypothetical protein